MKWLAIVVLAISGCCWLSKRSCFPACEKPLPPRIIKLERACELPPLKLPAVNQTDIGCPADRICFDRDNGAALYVRLAKLKDFAQMARQRCATPSSQPSSRPTQ